MHWIIPRAGATLQLTGVLYVWEPGSADRGM